jgi:hypothetical protein
MTDRNDPPGDLLGQAKAEISGMMKDKMEHPSTKPVLTGAAVGAVAGLVLPIVSLPVGLVAGAGIALWMRLKR